jgi:L-alanine-DL-glutamate epimerase-like enolase superfamily enzyme
VDEFKAISSSLIRIVRLHAFVFRAPIGAPIVTSFGVMRDRPMVLIRAEDDAGVTGWGEVWCNFPAVGAEHRARLVASIIAPLATSRAFDSPAQAFEFLTTSTAVLAIQSAEPGPIAQAIAGVDIALWDLVARRAGLPLWRALGGVSPQIAVYASGLGPAAPEELAAERLAHGFRAFKLKVGFGAERDLANLGALRETIDDCPLMVDANQVWEPADAHEMAKRMEPFDVAWLEEPIRADMPWTVWRDLGRGTAIPLAAGENLAGAATFTAALASRTLGVVQPDIAKWGGFSGGLPVARAIRAAGVRFCPHWLGGGIGLLASAHLLAAAGGDGLLEIDANPNPMRELTCGPMAEVTDGKAWLGEAPGLGIEVDLDVLKPYAVSVSTPS